jgi:aryl-alcohol dehydrogenase-like predicted oxidoreductase
LGKQFLAEPAQSTQNLIQTNMNRTNRREFLRQSLALGAAAAFPATAWPAAVTPAALIRRASDVIELGPAKVKVSRMAVGTGTYGGGHSSNQMRQLGADGLADVLSAAYGNGVFFWDTADGYGSHAAVKIALKKVPREKVAIVTKTEAFSAAKMTADLDRYRQELGTDYIDIVLLHSIMAPQWDELFKPQMDVLADAREKKIVRSVGISCHSVEAMKVASKSPWLDICMARINPAGVRMDAPTETVLPLLAELRANGKGLIGIKILGEGQLADRVDEALRFAVTKDAVHCFSIGCETRAELLENISRIAKVSQPA